MRRLFETIDGSYSKPEQIIGYCSWHKGCLTENLAKCHKCYTRNKGDFCRRFFPFFWMDSGKGENHPLTGEEYRNWLKSKKHR